jgi:ribosome-associated protein YbcJ (S4-like RNA binding protein)
MKFITAKQAKARISELRVKVAEEADPARRDRLTKEIRRLNAAGGAVEARSTYKSKLAALGRSMAGAY